MLFQTVMTWVCLESLLHYLLSQLTAEMHLTVNEGDLSAQDNHCMNSTLHHGLL